jgi:transcription initiation factor IIE alpha subunit
MSKHVLRKHLSNFTIVSNEIIKMLKNDLSSLGFYLHIVSLPDNWVFYKTALAKECGIGINKLEKILKKLKSLGLIQYGQKRNEQGRFSEFYLDVYDIETLKINDITPDVKNHRTVKTVAPFQEAIQERYTKKERSKEKKKEREPLSDFLPNPENVALAKSLNVDIQAELKSFKHRHSGIKTQYEFERWLNKAKEYAEKKKRVNTQSNLDQVRSTVQFWGPGHPGWESINAYRSQANRHSSV